MTILNNLNNCSLLCELWSLCKDGVPQISLLGNPYLYFPKYSQSLSIDTLADRIKCIVYQNFEFDENERLAGQQIVNLINKAYQFREKEIDKANLITRIVCLVKENIFHLDRKTSWDEDIDDTNMYFEYYTRSQYEKAFGKKPKGQGNLMISGCPSRWLHPDISAERQEALMKRAVTT